MNDVSNPFGSTAIAERQTHAMVEVEAQRVTAEVQAGMAMARRFPRDPRTAVDRIINACTRITLAEKAMYAYGRGGEEITGPSIRLAEALAQQWGNIKTSLREIDRQTGSEGRAGQSTMMALAWDLETGYSADRVFQVRHWRDTKKGGYPLKDERDIYELTANQGARRLRACILSVIPGDVVESAVKQCEVTLKTKIEVTPELIQKLIEKFKGFGVSKEQLELFIQRKIDSILPAQVYRLGKIFNSLTDGMSQPDDWFEAAATPVDGGEVVEKDGKQTGTDALKAAAAKAHATTADKPAAETKAPAAETKAVASETKADKTDTKAAGAKKAKPEDGAPSHTAQSVETAIKNAKDADALALARDLIRHTPNDVHTGLIALADEKQKQLGDGKLL